MCLSQEYYYSRLAEMEILLRVVNAAIQNYSAIRTRYASDAGFEAKRANAKAHGANLICSQSQRRNRFARSFPENCRIARSRVREFKSRGWKDWI